MSSIRDAVNLDLDAIVEASAALGYASRDSSELESDLPELIHSKRDRLWVFENHVGVVGLVASAPIRTGSIHRFHRNLRYGGAPRSSSERGWYCACVSCRDMGCGNGSQSSCSL